MERKLETGWLLPEFVVILNTELKVSWCLLETAGNQRADREQWKGQRTSSTEKELSEKGLKTSERHKGNGERRVRDHARHEHLRGRLSGVLMRQNVQDVDRRGPVWLSGGQKTKWTGGKHTPRHLLHLRGTWL